MKYVFYNNLLFLHFTTDSHMKLKTEKKSRKEICRNLRFVKMNSVIYDAFINMTRVDERIKKLTGLKILNQ